MNWSEKEWARLKHANGGRASDEALLDIAKCAVELVSARGAEAMREEDGRALGTVVAASDEGVRWKAAAWLSRRLAAQSATVATLQAEVAELKRVRHVAESRAGVLALERDEARNALAMREAADETSARLDLENHERFQEACAEVERLKDDLESAREDVATNQRVIAEEVEKRMAAESRLAAILERANSLAGVHKRAEASWVGVKDWDEACHQDVRAAGAAMYLHHAAEGVARWVLEGDAATPGHPERVKSLSAEVMVGNVLADPAPHGDDAELALEGIAETDAFNRGVEAMRAACWVAVQSVLQVEGFSEGGPSGMYERFKATIEGAAP